MPNPPDDMAKLSDELEALRARYEELRGWVTEALNLPGAPSGEARQALLNALIGVTLPEAHSEQENPNATTARK